MSSLIKFIQKAPWSARIGIIILVMNIAVAAFAPVISPYGETEITGDVWEEMSLTHPLGTDHLGRDLLTRLIYGARNTIGLALMITFLSFTLGTLGGFLAATLGGWCDTLLSRTVDLVLSFPTLIFALMVLSVVGTSIFSLICVIAILDATRVFRLARAVAMDIAVMDFVEAGRLRGEKTGWIILREILPNALPPLVAEFGLRFCFVFLFIAGLSFLGLGIQPPTADWGSMVKENAGAITFGIFTPLWPAAAIAFITVGVNLIVDWFLNLASGLKE
jgi:peptide/nickel transport system permease protein